MGTRRSPESRSEGGGAGASRPDRASTGIEGLDQILGGGFPRDRTYFIQGASGTGKTTLGLQFLLEGVRRGERALYVTLGWSKEEIGDIARSHDWALDGVEIHELGVGERFNVETRQTIFHPGEVELTETMAALLQVVDAAPAARVVVDPLLELRLLAADPLQYRRQITLLRQHFAKHNSTAMLLDDVDPHNHAQIETLVHGVVRLGRTATRSRAHRWLRVEGMRATPVHEGTHDASLITGGLRVYPRPVAGMQPQAPPARTISSGIAALDRLLGGELGRGTSLLLLGPAGVGKSTVAVQYAIAAATRGERAAVYLFTEAPATLIPRCDALGMRLTEHIAAGNIGVYRVDPDCSPGEFANRVGQAIERDDARVVVIDGLAEFVAPAGEWMSALRALSAYLAHQQVLLLLVAPPAPGSAHDSNFCHLADTVLVFGYYQHAGAVRQSVSVLKRRERNHERTMHDLRLGEPGAIQIGAALARP